MTKAIISTSKGDMHLELYDDDAPITVENFVKLANIGFYNNIKFHRVIKDFMAQTGCPDGDGRGGPGYNIKCELKGELQYHDRGVLSMANKGYRNSGGSQFFICYNRDGVKHLDGKHTCFGKVAEGLDVLDSIAQGDDLVSVVITP
jgi:peptidyl-prolyl cis-trans isomerase B (cyclophilin B)